MTELNNAAAHPTTPWLQSCVGAAALWRPTELPERLEHAASRTFLETVGYPAIALSAIRFDASELPVKGLWEEDPDELFGRRVPDDDSAPAKYCYGFGVYGNDYTLMLDGELGVVDIYDPSGWDHGEGYQGRAFDSLAELAGSVGLMARHLTRLDAGEDPEAVLSALRASLITLGWAGSGFWISAFEHLEEEYGEF
ncbi:hypothetical protein [Nocardia jejuensis]|uniref:hypothetical protein n=1 Tax=Nocardia jejuensis TaxID=328049 RepID=UPI000831A732|nr:hypothetical protein [Nocardia jejuensis]